MKFVNRYATSIAALAMICLCVGVTYAARYMQEPTDAKTIIWVDDPVKTMAGESECLPCNQLVSDLLQKYKVQTNGKRIVGVGQGHIFEVRAAPPSMDQVPTVSFDYDDGTRKVVTGYNGNHAALVRMHPKFREKQNAVPADQSLIKVAKLSHAVAKGEGQQSSDGPPVSEACWVQSYSYAPYSQSNCNGTQSYYTPYSSNCNGGGGYSPPIGGGGNDFYTPPQAFQPAYYRQAYQPRSYYQPSFQSQFSRQSGSWVCGPNGCYRVR